MNGHERLLADLKSILVEAEAFEFDDFKNSRYALPKLELVSQLTAIAGKATRGEYDQ